jgi:hypothetical protein
VGESLTRLPAGRTTWCAFSPQTGVDITERTQKKQERASRSYAHLFRFAVPSLLQGRIRALDHHPFSCIYPQSIRLLLLLWLDACPVKAWLSAGSLFFFFHWRLPSLHLAERTQSFLDRPQSTLFRISSSTSTHFTPQTV